jgi:hypothetical protein
MARVIKCGFCGHAFESSDGAAELVACPACGWMVPTGGGAPAQESPKPAAQEEEGEPPLAFGPLYVPQAAAPGEPRRAHVHPSVRARWLAEPWRDVRESLILARRANFVAMGFAVLLVVLDLAALALLDKPPPRSTLTGILSFLGIFALLIAVMHTVAQFGCAHTPATHGGLAALAAAFAAVFAGAFLAILMLVDLWAFGVLAFGALYLASWMAWLAYLIWLGKTLPDAELTQAAGWYAAWYFVGTLVSVSLGAATYYQLRREDFFSARVYQWLTIVVGLALGFGYHLLLAVAAEAVARRAPLDAAAANREHELASANRRPWLNQ